MRRISETDRVVSGDTDMQRAVEAQRQSLLQQIDSARQALTNQLEALRSADTLHTHSDVEANAIARIERLSALRDQLIGGAKGLADLRADIVAAVAASLVYTSRVSSAATASQDVSSQQAALQAASANTHQTVSDFARDFYERRIFDPYLRFASAEDEEAYHRREAERREAIDKALAEGTPEGNLRASKLSLAQLEDAGAHGADRSPDYNRWHDDLRASSTRLSAAMEGTRPRRAASVARAVSDEKPETPLSPELLASLRGAGVTIPDQNGTGHGVAAKPVNRPDQPLPPH